MKNPVRLQMTTGVYRTKHGQAIRTVLVKDKKCATFYPSATTGATPYPLVLLCSLYFRSLRPQ